MPSLATDERSSRPQVDIKEYNHLRSQILHNAPALHRVLPRVIHHSYTVITACSASIDKSTYQASLITYYGSNSSTGSILLRKSAPKENLVQALQDLLHSMEQDLGTLLEKTAIGDVMGSYKIIHVAGDKTHFSKVMDRENVYPPPHTLPASLKSDSQPRSPSLALSDSFRERKASYDMSMEYLRSQGFAQPESSTTPPSQYQVYRKPVASVQQGYKA